MGGIEKPPSQTAPRKQRIYPKTSTASTLLSYFPHICDDGLEFGISSGLADQGAGVRSRNRNSRCLGSSLGCLGQRSAAVDDKAHGVAQIIQDEVRLAGTLAVRAGTARTHEYRADPGILAGLNIGGAITDEE